MVCLACCAAPAEAATFKTGVRSTISAAGVLPPACGVTGAASYPTLAVDPQDDRRITAVWLGDGLTGVASSSSTDGGRRWVREAVRDATTCTGAADREREVVNPRIAAGPGGRVWWGRSWVGFFEPLLSYDTSVLVRDKVSGWRSGPSFSGSGQAQNVVVAPDRDDPQAALAFTTRQEVPPTPSSLGYSPLSRTSVIGGRTSDGGRTWSPMTVVAPGEETVNELSVARVDDRTVVLAFDTVAAADVAAFATGQRDVVPFTLRVTRSDDDGRTWSPPVVVGRHDLRRLPDPEGRVAKAPAGFAKFELTTSPDGTRTELVWAGLEGVRGQVLRATSRDGGRSWSAPTVLVERPAPLWAVAAAHDGRGRLGVFFYDWADDRRDDAALTTAARVVVEGQLVTLPSSFDLRRTLVDGVVYDGDQPLGVTQDLQGLEQGFAAAHTVGPPVSAPATEVRFTTVVPKRAARPGRKRR